MFEDTMKSAPFTSEPIEVFALAMKDLQAARDWEAARPGVRLVVTTDRIQVYEAIDIYVREAVSSHWCIWRDASGGFHVDDWRSVGLDRTFPTLATAFDFISSEMSGLEQSPLKPSRFRL
jgi:hypothetical protein